jgi:hypothetical protein
MEGILGEPTGTGEGAFSRGFPSVDAEHDARHTADVAREYLIAGASGKDCAQLAVKLASAVLSREDVRLAFEVLAGGPFCHARATELASRVLGRESEEGAKRRLEREALAPLDVFSHHLRHQPPRSHGNEPGVEGREPGGDQIRIEVGQFASWSRNSRANVVFPAPFGPARMRTSRTFEAVIGLGVHSSPFLT